MAKQILNKTVNGELTQGLKWKGISMASLEQGQKQRHWAPQALNSGRGFILRARPMFNECCKCEPFWMHCSAQVWKSATMTRLGHYTCWFTCLVLGRLSAKWLELRALARYCLQPRNMRSDNSRAHQKPEQQTLAPQGNPWWFWQQS